MNEQRKFFLSVQAPLLPGALVKAEGWRSWASKILDDPGWWRECHICGRREDFVFNFVHLTPVWDGEQVVKECRRHGPKSLWDIQTGDEVIIPEPPCWPRVQRAVEGMVLGSAIVVRFCWFLLVGALWRLVASNDITFGLVCAVWKRRGVRGMTSQGSERVQQRHSTSEARLRQGQERSGGMTWERFVEIVEAILEEQGLDRDTQIWFVDVLGPHAKEEARISVRFKCGEGLSIHNM